MLDIFIICTRDVDAPLGLSIEMAQFHIEHGGLYFVQSAVVSLQGCDVLL